MSICQTLELPALTASDADSVSHIGGQGGEQGMQLLIAPCGTPQHSRGT